MKRLSLGTAIVAVAALAAVPAVAQSPSAPAPTTIRFGTYNEPFVAAVNQMLVDNFKATHPGSDVQVEYMPSDSAAYSAALATQAAAGTLPDVLFTADLYVGALRAAGHHDRHAAAGGCRSDVRPERRLPQHAGPRPRRRRGPVHDPVVVRRGDHVLQQDHVRGGRRAAAQPRTGPGTTTSPRARSSGKRPRTTASPRREPPTGLNSVAWWAYYVPWIVGYGGKILSDDGKTALLSSPETLAGLRGLHQHVDRG